MEAYQNRSWLLKKAECPYTLPVLSSYLSGKMVASAERHIGTAD